MIIPLTLSQVIIDTGEWPLRLFVKLSSRVQLSLMNSRVSKFSHSKYFY